MQRPRFEVLEHTSETGIAAYGTSAGEIFATAAYGMFSLMTDLSKVRATGEYRVRLRAADLGDLMVDWLTQLLFLHETNGIYFNEFEVSLEGTTLHATVRGEKIDRRRHRPKIAVKAVTHHQLEVKPWEGFARIILDV